MHKYRITIDKVENGFYVTVDNDNVPSYVFATDNDNVPSYVFATIKEVVDFAVDYFKED